LKLLSHAEQLSRAGAHGISHSSGLGVIFKPNSAFNGNGNKSLQRISQVRVHGSTIEVRSLNFALGLLHFADDRLGLLTALAEFSFLLQANELAPLL